MPEIGYFPGFGLKGCLCHRYLLIWIFRYVEKRWISRDGNAKSPSVVTEDKGSIFKTQPEVNSGTRYVSRVKHYSEERKSN